MDALQIIKMGKVAVRNSATAYPIYQNLFKEAFGFVPECPTCGSVNGHRHWQQFEAYAKGAEPLSLINQNTTIMSKPSFEIKNKSKIYSYQFEKNGRTLTARIYGDVMTEDFAKNYLESAQGDEELLAKRSAEFKTLPKGFGDTAGTTATDSTYPEKLADKKAYAAEQGYPEEEYKSIRSNADMEAYLDEKASEADPVDADPADADADPADADPADVSEDLS